MVQYGLMINHKNATLQFIGRDLDNVALQKLEMYDKRMTGFKCKYKQTSSSNSSRPLCSSSKVGLCLEIPGFDDSLR